MRAVVDASVAIASLWEVAAEDRFDEAFDEPAVVPPIFLTEVANAALTKVRRRQVSLDEAQAGLQDIAQNVTVTRAATERLAFDVAVATGLTAYDAMYLACAQAWHLPLWTLDRRLRDAASAAGVVVRP